MRKLMKYPSPIDLLYSVSASGEEPLEQYSSDDIENLSIEDVETRLAELNIDASDVVRRVRELVGPDLSTSPLEKLYGVLDFGDEAVERLPAEDIEILPDEVIRDRIDDLDINLDAAIEQTKALVRKKDELRGGNSAGVGIGEGDDEDYYATNVFISSTSTDTRKAQARLWYAYEALPVSSIFHPSSARLNEIFWEQAKSVAERSRYSVEWFDLASFKLDRGNTFADEDVSGTGRPDSYARSGQPADLVQQAAILLRSAIEDFEKATVTFPGSSRRRGAIGFTGALPLPDATERAGYSNSRAGLYRNKGRYAKDYQQALVVDEKSLGPERPSVAHDPNKLSDSLSERYWNSRQVADPKVAIEAFEHGVVVTSLGVPERKGYVLSDGLMGKTQLALECSYRPAHEYAGLWWLRAETPETPVADYAALANAAGLPEREVTVDAVRRWLAGEDRVWLLVLDNTTGQESMRDYLPELDCHHVLVTSRNPIFRGVATPLEVKVFKREESVEDRCALDLDDAVAVLRRRSLIETTDELWSVHRLLKAVTHDWLRGGAKKWAEATMALVSGAFPYKENDLATWTPSDTLLPHALSAAGHAEAVGAGLEATGRLLNEARSYLLTRAQLAEARSVLEHALAIREKALGSEHPNTTRVRKNYAVLLEKINVQAEALAEALAVAHAIGDEGCRAEALAALALQLPEAERAEALAEALAVARAIGDEGSRARAFTALAPRLPEPERGEVLAEALATTRGIRDKGSRARAFTALAFIALAPQLPEPERGEVLVEAMAAARGIGDEWSRAEALTALAPQLPEELLAEALVSARAIGDEGCRAEALAALALRLANKCFMLVRAFVGPESFLGTLHDVRALIDEPATSNSERAAAGDQLNGLSPTGDPRPGVGLRDGLPDIEWVAIPGGTIMLHGVSGSFHVQPFHMARYPVTWTQYRAFLEDPHGYNDSAWWDDLTHEDQPGEQYRRLGNCPADNVSWHDAMAYCRWLTARLRERDRLTEGKVIRLPTEWEWQQAATGGEPNNTYPWGTDWDSVKANTTKSGLARSTAVGLYPAGTWEGGPLDMAGNVWEWCLNKRRNPRKTAPDTSNDSRMIRGGSWLHDQDRARADYRNYAEPDFRFDNGGFRVSLETFSV